MKTKILTNVLKSKTFNKAIKAIVANAPKILTGISIASSIAATGFAIKGTVVAVKVEKERKEKIASGELPVPKHPKWETVKSVYKCYIPSAAFLSISIGSSLYGTGISSARTAMATAAYKASELALEEFRAKAVQELGEEKVQKIDQAIAQEHMEQYAAQPTTLLVDPYQDYPCMDKFTGQIIRTNVEEIRHVFNQINYDLSRGPSDFISLASYCDYFGIDCKNELIGWNIVKTGLLSPRFDYGVYDKNGAPMIVFSTSIEPSEKYDIYG